VKCARLDQRVFHQRLVETRDAKGDQLSENKAVRTGSTPVNCSALFRANSKT
jgi:head-tail adaptor